MATSLALQTLEIILARRFILYDWASIMIFHETCRVILIGCITAGGFAVHFQYANVEALYYSTAVS